MADWMTDYLCFKARTENSTITLTKTGSPSWTGSYSYNYTDWYDYTPETWVDGQTTYTNTITLTNVGDKVYFKGIYTGDNSSSNYLRFVMTGSISATGDIMSLCSGDNYPIAYVIPYAYMFFKLFYGCTSLVIPPKLPALTLNSSCYNMMFNSCTSLVVPPILPATVLYRDIASVYRSMFYKCTSLHVLPKLPGCVEEPPLEMPYYGYANMFQYCTNLILNSYTSGTYTLGYRIPTSADTYGISQGSCLNNMFANTGTASTRTTPTLGSLYYVEPDCSIVYDGEEILHLTLSTSGNTNLLVVYNNTTIFAAGQKVNSVTLKCKEKVMRTDVTIYIKDDNTTLLVKTLKCANKKMKSNLTIYLG